MADNVRSPLTGNAVDHSNHLEEKSRGSPLASDFDPLKQAWFLFKDQGLRLLYTIVLIALFVLSLVLFERAGNVSHSRKLWFNAVTTILNLALGINFVEVFKDLAKVLRWRVLASRPSTIRETDLILGGESLLKLWTLMWESHKKPVTILVCAVWITLNLVAQATIAMLSLNYSMNSGADSTGIYTQSGNVSAARLDCYYEPGGCPSALTSQITTAHTYGELIRGQQCCPFSNDTDLKTGNQTCPYFCHTNGQEFANRYVEYNPQDTAQAFPFLTSRNIRSSASQCYEYEVDWSKSRIIDSTDGKQDTQLFAFHNSTFAGSLAVPNSDGAFNSTTYIYNGTLLPQDATSIACGPRCLTMWVLRLGTPPPGGVLPADIFSCNVAVSNVFNATESWQNVPDDMARLAIASIALTGRWTSPPSGFSWQQYQLYSWGSFMEAHGKSAQEIGVNIANFTMGSLASMANLNPKSRQYSPTLPQLGFGLDVNWRFAIALFACIGSVHAILVGLLLWVSRCVVVLDDSDLCIARLLHELAGRLGDEGSLLDDKRIAKEIGQRGASGDVRVVYGTKVVQGEEGVGKEVRVLALGDDMYFRKGPRNTTFSKGAYA